MPTANKLLREIHFDKEEKTFSVSQPLVFKDTTMSVQELQNFLAPIQALMIRISKGNGFIEYDDWIKIFVINIDRLSTCWKFLCFLPFLVSAWTVFIMIPLYFVYFIFIVPFWFCCCKERNDQEIDEAKNKVNQFVEESNEAYKSKDLKWVYEPDFNEVDVYCILRGEEAERELEERRRQAEIRARNEEIQRREDEANRRRNMMMMIAVGNMINHEVQNFQHNMEAANERNREIINLAILNQQQQQQQQQQYQASLNSANHHHHQQPSAPETKSETTATGYFKVNGWGCDALFLKTNATVTRCNSKGDPSNTGEYLVVHTTSKPMSIRFESVGTWISIPASSEKFFISIPPQLLQDRLIEIEAHYTPSY